MLECGEALSACAYCRRFAGFGKVVSLRARSVAECEDMPSTPPEGTMLRKLMMAFACVLAAPFAAAADELPLDLIELPPGFRIELWARVDNARQMTLGRVDRAGGTLFVGSM